MKSSFDGICTALLAPAASVLLGLPGSPWLGGIKSDDVLVGALGATFMMIVLWLIIRDASKSPPRDHRG
ncbi:MAG: hypothetical protein ACKOE8_00595 [Opitutaceae bacterium]